MNQFSQEYQQQRPFTCLKILVGSFADQPAVLKSQDEINRHMSDVQETVVKEQDPKRFYSEPDIGDMLDSGSFGEVFLVKRLSDQKQFALKVSKRAERSE